MANIKTAISIDEPLFREADETAHRLGVPRSRLFAMAMAEFLERRRGSELLMQINDAYADDDQTEELEVARLAKPGARRISED